LSFGEDHNDHRNPEIKDLIRDFRFHKRIAKDSICCPAMTERSFAYLMVGTTVIAAPCVFAASFETTTHVRVFVGSTPIDGSKPNHTLPPVEIQS